MHIYVQIYTHVKSFLQKTQSLNLALALRAAHFLEWRLMRFEKNGLFNMHVCSKCVYMSICVHIRICINEY